MLPHDLWLKEIAESRDILINPGLEGALDVISHERPMFFLPPYNSSAYVELDEFRERKIAVRSNSIHFADYFPYKNLAGRNLRKIMEEFLEELRRFENSPEILEDCAKRINKYLGLPQELKDKQIVRQKQFLARLGNNGLDKTIQLINNLLEKIQRSHE